MHPEWPPRPAFMWPGAGAPQAVGCQTGAGSLCCCKCEEQNSSFCEGAFVIIWRTVRVATFTCTIFGSIGLNSFRLMNLNVMFT